MDRDQEWLLMTCQRLIGGKWTGNKLIVPATVDGKRRSIRHVAEFELGMTGAGLTRWLNGESRTESITLGNWRALAKALGVSTADLCESYDNYMKGGDKGPDKSKLELIDLKATLEQAIKQISILEMAEKTPAPDNDNVIMVGRLSTFLQILLSEYGLDWTNNEDVIRFAELTGKIGDPGCPWLEGDADKPDGLLWQAIAGTLAKVTDSLIGGLSISCSALAGKEISPDDIVRICNGTADYRIFLNGGCAKAR